MDNNEISDSLQLQLEMDLKKLLAVNEQVRAVLLATTDGFEVAYCGDLGSSTPSNISAMTSSMLSLAIAMVNETGLSSCHNLMVEGGQGQTPLVIQPLLAQLHKATARAQQVDGRPACLPREGAERHIHGARRIGEV